MYSSVIYIMTLPAKNIVWVYRQIIIWNEVIPLCIDSIYSLYYIYSSQHNYKIKAVNLKADNIQGTFIKYLYLTRWAG